MVFDNAPIGVYTVSPAGLIETANRKFAEISGERMEDLIGLNTLTIQSYKESGMDTFVREGLLGKPFETEVRHVSTLARKATWRHYRGVPIFSTDGAHVEHLLLLLEDVTVRKELELKLEDYAKSLESQVEERTIISRATLNSIAEGILAVDAVGKVLSVNKRFCDMWNLPKDLVEKSDDANLVSFVVDQLKDGNAFRERVSELYAHPEVVSSDTIGFKDGRVFERYTQGLATNDGRILGRVWSFRDVTQDKRAEERLRLSEQDLSRVVAENQTILDAAPPWIFYKDTENRFVRVNRAFCEAMGKSKEELESKSLYDIYPRAQADAYWADDKQVIQSGNAKLGIVEEIAIKDGELRTLKTDKIPYRDSNGTIVGIIGFAEDITEQKKSEQALHQSEERLDAIVRNGNDIITVISIDGDIKYQSPAVRAVVGYEPEELLGKNIMPFVHPADLAAATALLAKGVMNPGTSYKGIFRFKHKDGHWVHLDVVGAYRPEIASIDGVVINSRDISERIHAEEVRKESQMFLQNIINLLPVRIFWKDRNGVFLGCNQAFAHDAGMASPEEVIGKDDFHMGWKDQADQYRADDCRVMDSGPKVDIEEPQTTPEGKTIWLATTKVPLKNGDGDVIGILGTYTDITSKKEIEKVREDNTKEIERVNKVMIGRELKMIELKKEIERLKSGLQGGEHPAQMDVTDNVPTP